MTYNVLPAAPLVSVVIVVYNGEQYLRAAIDSITAQTYETYELIVVDDSSTDGSAAIARSFPQIRYLYQSNQGPGIARNTGIAAAAGDYLAFLDADDLWVPEKLALQIDYVRSNPTVPVLFGHMHNFLEAGQARPVWMPESHLDEPMTGLSPCTLLARRDVFDQVGRFAPAYSRHASDLEWFARLHDSRLPYAILPDVLLHRRIHATNLSHATYHDWKRIQFEIVKASIERRRDRAR